tara:strand:- start:1250 stop:3175 length:1926 start_codon:yes stop_codon:yes gene_type:complete
MAQAAEKVLEFPSGGIADFYMEDHEIEALEREEAAEEFGSAGIATFEPIAHRMASYGRYGDDTVAHVETGELIVPKALIDDNPKLRDSIFSHLRELGVEDPERYVVGSGANSLNPETGMPEFFLKKLFKGAKKAVSKVAKGVSKAFKGITKVLKKAAPVIIPFALNAMFPGLGAIYSGALGSGIGTLLQGGSMKDAFQSALIGGAIGGATAAIGGGLKAANTGGSFGKGAMAGIQDAAKLSNLRTAGQQLASGQFGQAGYEKVLADQALVTPASETLASVQEGVTPQSVADKATDFQGQYAQGAGTTATDAGTTLQTIPPGSDDFVRDENIYKALTGGVDRAASAPALDPNYKPFAGPNKAAYEAIANNPSLSSTEKMIQLNNLTKTDPAALLNQTGGVNLSAPPVTAGPDQMFLGAADALPPTPPPTILEQLQSAGETAMDYGQKGMDFLTGGTPADNDIYKLAGEKMAAAKQAGVPLTGDAAIKSATAELTPGIIRTYGPATALAGTAAYAGGMFDAPDEGPSDEELMAQLGPTGYELYKANEAKYGVAGGTPLFSQGQYAVPTTFAADGGEIFPRRVGGIMPNEGTPGKDSVRAMLMPGEFVMTTDAVKGLGNGNNDQGIKNMYQMMRGLEAKGKAMA